MSDQFFVEYMRKDSSPSGILATCIDPDRLEDAYRLEPLAFKSIACSDRFRVVYAEWRSIPIRVTSYVQLPPLGATSDSEEYADQTRLLSRDEALAEVAALNQSTWAEHGEPSEDSRPPEPYWYVAVELGEGPRTGTVTIALEPNGLGVETRHNSDYPVRLVRPTEAELERYRIE